MSKKQSKTKDAKPKSAREQRVPKKVRREFEEAGRVIRARYDAAQTNDHNSQHWAMTDSLSSRAALNPGVRKKLRERSRYEIENNSWLAGIIETLSHHTIGIGPRLQILHRNEAACLRVQRAHARWAKAVGFAEKLLTLKKTWGGSGECYALKIRNKNLWPIQLDFRLYEPDQVANPYAYFDPQIDDGVKIDLKTGLPEAYFFLNWHPGDNQFSTDVMKQGEWYDAKEVLHYFHRVRPGQLHGVPPLTPSLELAPILRRFTRAAIKAAEVAASHSSVIRTTAASVEVAGSPRDFAAIEFEAGMHTILPEGWDISQMKSEHPNSSYEMVIKWVLNEIARPLSMPFNIAACNSAGYNYSSGRLDHQTYYKSIEVDQSLIESTVLDPLFRSWLEEAMFVQISFEQWVSELGLVASELSGELLAILEQRYREDSPSLLDGLPPIDELEWQWCWDAQPVIDEGTDADASTKRIQSGQSTLPLEWQRRGYGDVQAQQQKGAESLGLSIEQYQELLQFQLFGTTSRQLGAIQQQPQAATGGPAAGNAPAEAAPTLGVSTGVRKRDVTNNQKLAREVLKELIAGGSEALARVDLKRLGYSDTDIQAMIDDARDGTIDSGTLDELQVPA